MRAFRHRCFLDTDSFIDTATLGLSSTRCRWPNKRSSSQRTPHAYVDTTTLASHPFPYRFQNLMYHPLWNLSLIPVMCKILLKSILKIKDKIVLKKYLKILR